MTKTQRFTLVATSLGLFMIYLDALIVNVALPAIQSDFKVGEAGLQWVVTAYSLGMTIAIMSSGTAADIYGRRKPRREVDSRVIETWGCNLCDDLFHRFDFVSASVKVR